MISIVEGNPSPSIIENVQENHDLKMKYLIMYICDLFENLKEYIIDLPT